MTKNRESTRKILKINVALGRWDKLSLVMRTWGNRRGVEAGCDGLGDVKGVERVDTGRRVEEVKGFTGNKKAWEGREGGRIPL